MARLVVIVEGIQVEGARPEKIPCRRRNARVEVAGPPLVAGEALPRMAAPGLFAVRVDEPVPVTINDQDGLLTEPSADSDPSVDDPEHRLRLSEAHLESIHRTHRAFAEIRREPFVVIAADREHAWIANDTIDRESVLAAEETGRLLRLPLRRSRLYLAAAYSELREALPETTRRQLDFWSADPRGWAVLRLRGRNGLAFELHEPAEDQEGDARSVH